MQVSFDVMRKKVRRGGRRFTIDLVLVRACCRLSRILARRRGVPFEDRGGGGAVGVHDRCQAQRVDLSAVVADGKGSSFCPPPHGALRRGRPRFQEDATVAAVEVVYF